MPSVHIWLSVVCRWSATCGAATHKEKQEAMAVTTSPYASDALPEGTVDAVVIGGAPRG
ncbi:hypothetical protein GCM10022226_80740 [Sphaerisporangium flaviroseum]|uniref:Uncharacterized protein n=1 Tax=Sphaerisporangium flaviroseum TaxID=509199 RepID=A0ABP7JHV9_9ACTN